MNHDCQVHSARIISVSTDAPEDVTRVARFEVTEIRELAWHKIFVATLQREFQNFKSGNSVTSSASVETLMLCHALASDSRLSSAKSAYCTAIAAK